MRKVTIILLGILSIYISYSIFTIGSKELSETLMGGAYGVLKITLVLLDNILGRIGSAVLFGVFGIVLLYKVFLKKNS